MFVYFENDFLILCQLLQIINLLSYLIIKWLIVAALLNKKRLPFVKKLQQEVVLILKKHSSSQALKLKKLNNTKANSNRANIHFRW